MKKYSYFNFLLAVVGGLISGIIILGSERLVNLIENNRNLNLGDRLTLGIPTIALILTFYALKKEFRKIYK